MANEQELLLDTLDAQRDDILGAHRGLGDEELRRPVLASGWTCLGPIRHLALADERYWFRCIVGGHSLAYFPDEPGATGT